MDFNRRGRHFKKNTKMPFTSFIFKEGEWIADYYNSFYEKTEVLKKGVLKINRKTSE
jgi:hypothetical protein